ncbi:hypothetical protein ROA7450_03425 [Roseovarius albus]|uniref:Glycosyl transferase family 2 n=2 Tax=Roseovarius albus TaxID=1247867 RepID=A0A1X6ZXQ7_9RHOB|nr:hypothetical protein ROA7450_03425 [Roseovarius albus]
MVYKGYWHFECWIRHYSKILGRQNLFVVLHGADDRAQRIANGCNVITVPRESYLERFDRKRFFALSNFRDFLLASYDIVLQSDADELLFADCEDGLLGALKRLPDQPAIFTLGFELIEVENDNLVSDEFSLLSQRRNGIFFGKYTKASVFRKKGVKVMMHGYSTDEIASGKHGYALADDIYLAHLRFSNTYALSSANAGKQDLIERVEIAPSRDWTDPETTREKLLTKFDKAELLDFSLAAQHARRALGTGVRRTRIGRHVLHAPPQLMPHRFILPDRFSDYC